MGILRFIFDMISRLFSSGKKRRKRRINKKALLRARNAALHRIFMARKTHLENAEKTITVEKLIRRSIRLKKKRSKMKWQEKMNVISHNARLRDLEKRKQSMKERIASKREKARDFLAVIGR